MQYDMEELLEQANEVQESLSRSYAVPDEIDEADLEAGAPFPLTYGANSQLKG
jgi:charged multivesicular body protein 5